MAQPASLAGSLVLAAVIAGIGMLVGKGIGFLLLVLAGGVVVWSALRAKPTKVSVQRESATARASKSGARPEPGLPEARPQPLPRRVFTDPIRGTAPVGETFSTGFRIPPPSTAKPTSTDGDEYWVPLNDQRSDLGGGVYVGQGLASATGVGIEPALVNLDLQVDRGADDYRMRRLNYWPSFDSATPQARGAYLHWLRSGRDDPTADIGYIFLYYYGLERRALVDTNVSVRAREELPTIVREISRLLTLYGHNHSFRRFASSLRDYLAYQSGGEAQYKLPPSAASPHGLTFPQRLALAQCAADGAPLPVDWAYLWLGAETWATRRAVAARYPDIFRELFVGAYQRAHGDGLVLPRNQTRLKLEYRPASPGFGGHAPPAVSASFDLPDVGVLKSPLAKLEQIADACHQRLLPYNRFVNRNPGKETTFDAMVELPVFAWEASARRHVLEAKHLVERSGKPLALPFEKLTSWLPPWESQSKSKAVALCRAFADVGLGIEPDPRYGGQLPAPHIVIYLEPAPDSPQRKGGRYAAAALTLQLAVAVALADGSSTLEEREMLATRLENGFKLTDAERRRLHARLRLLLLTPPKLTGLKPRIEALAIAERAAIGDFLALVAQADGTVAASEVKALERTFKLLGLDQQHVYTKLHTAGAAASGNVTSAGSSGPKVVPAGPRDVPKGGFALDAARVAALQADTERVAALLGSIFNQPEPEPDAIAEEPEQETRDSGDARVMGLDASHSDLVHAILSRPQWTRAELEELASDRGVMLAGALERINDASFEAYEQPLVEGDDPIEVNEVVAAEVAQ